MEKINRRLIPLVSSTLESYSAVVLTGARGVGKTTLARDIASKRVSVIYNLDAGDDRGKLAHNVAEELQAHSNKLVVVDAAQHLPQIFKELRAIIDGWDNAGNKAGRFLLLGTSDGTLQGHYREFLSGRMARIRLHGLDWLEVSVDGDLRRLWDRGGYPQSYLAEDDVASMRWRKNYIESSIVGDMANAGVQAPKEMLEELLRQVAACQGRFANLANLASILKIKHSTVSKYLGLFEELKIVRKLPAYSRSEAKRIAKRPKYYICDSGIMGALSNLSVNPAVMPGQETMADASWEGFVIENLMSVLPLGWQASHYRSHAGHEIDLVFERAGRRPWAVEIKSGNYVMPSSKTRKALAELRPERAFQVYAGSVRHRLSSDIVALPLVDMMNELLAQDPTFVSDYGWSKTAKARDDAAVLLMAIRDGRRDVPFLRKEFVRSRLSDIRELASEAASLDDSNFRNGWKRVRSELASWFEAESTVDGDSPSCAYWPSMRTLLDGLLEIKFAGGMRGNDSKIGKIVAGWCAFDTFVNAIAALLYNDRFNLIHFLLTHGYYARGRMRKSSGFWTAASSASAEADAALSSLVFDDQIPEAHALVEAELICMLYSIANLGEQGSNWFWYPRLYGGVPNKDLPFFGRATDRATGMTNLLTCLGLGDDMTGYDNLRQLTRALLQSQQQSRFFDFENLLAAMCFGDRVG